MIWRRAFAAVAMAMAGTCAHAQAFPSKPIRLVVPFAVGSGTDILARVIGEEVQRNLGTSIIVENKPGAGGQIAAEIVTKAAPDGYTLLMGTNTALSANPFLYRKLTYDPIKDFTPIARTNYFLFLLVVAADSPMKSTADVIARAKANPGKVSYGYGNSTGQVAGAHFARGGGFQALAVPYKSTPPALTDLASGQIDFMFVDLASSQNYMRGGKLRAIAVQSDERSALLPELPAAGEVVPGFTFVAFGGVVGPAGMPRDVVARLNAEFTKALGTPAVKERMAALGLEPAPMSPEAFGRFMSEQLTTWGRKIAEAGIQPE